MNRLPGQPMYIASNTGQRTLETIRKRGVVVCGINVHLAGFALPESPNDWSGFNIDYGRAIAAAVLGDANKVKFIPLDAGARFQALTSGQVDVLVRNVTWTLSRDVSLGADFQTIIFYEGQGVMVRKEKNIRSIHELDGATLCITRGQKQDINTTTGDNIIEFFQRHAMTCKVIVVHDDDDALMAYRSRKCDVFTSGIGGLHAERLRLDDPDQHIILPEIISKEPLSTVVRDNDPQWAKVVRWVHFALIAAEELGFDAKSVNHLIDEYSLAAEAKRLFGMEGNLGQQLGLSRHWAKNIIQEVGHYGNIFDRNLGVDSELQMERGLNNLWTQGGLLFAPPFK